MRGSELVVKMRSRLRDEAAEGWSDDELFDSINFALSAIASKLLPWKGRWSTVTIIGSDTYSIPEDFMAPISLYVDGNAVEIKGIEWAMSHDSSEEAAFIDLDSLILYPTPTSEVSLMLNYHASRTLESLSDVLHITTEMVDTVLYYALSMALQKQANEESLSQSQYYLKLYHERCSDIAKITSQRRSATRIQSKFQKV